MMQINRMDIDGVTIPVGHRAVNPDTVARLKESMAKFGLMHPISVYAPDDAHCYLISGRVPAAERWLRQPAREGQRADG